jgi:hypothetical protein
MAAECDSWDRTSACISCAFDKGYSYHISSTLTAQERKSICGACCFGGWLYGVLPSVLQPIVLTCGHACQGEMSLGAHALLPLAVKVAYWCRHAFIISVMSSRFDTGLFPCSNMRSSWHLQYELSVTDASCCSGMSHDGSEGRCDELALTSGCWENVAYKIEEDKMAACTKAMELWETSPGHKENMLADDATLNGVGYHDCGDGKMSVRNPDARKQELIGLSLCRRSVELFPDWVA